MNIHKIVIPTPYAVGDVNAFLVKGDALTLFDAGPKTEEALEAIRFGIKEAGYKLSDIDQVVLTHHHPDHAGWVDAFPTKDILGHEYVDHWLRQEKSFVDYRLEFYKHQLQVQAVPEPYLSYILEVRGELEMIGRTPLTKTLSHGEEVPGHKDLIAYYTPGHAQSHLIFHDKQTNEVIGGDLLLDKVSSNPLVEPPADLSFERPLSLLQYNESLKFIADLHPTVVYTGHGENVINANQLVEERLARQHKRAMKVLEMLTTPKTIFEVTTELFPKVYAKQPGLTLSETLGQLDYLVDRQLATIKKHDSIEYYQKIELS